jgi:regulator of protease activity HflC (stomatin/prohibitin superfamily)
VTQANTGGGPAYLYNLAQLPIRAAAASASLDDILSNRDSIPTQVADALRQQFQPLGLSLLDVSIRDIMLSREIRDAFAAPAIALKQGQAALERARGEVASMRALANAARIARDNPEILKLRALQLGDAARQTLVVDLGGSAESKGRRVSPEDLGDEPA